MAEKPEIREGVINDFLAYMRSLLESHKEGGIYKTCLTCICFKEQAEFCTQWNEKPPARIIAYGCSKYTHDDEVPF